MSVSIILVLFGALGVTASGTDVTNNLFSDIGPLLALFGENFAQQFLRESFTWLDHIVFAMAPLGIITAIVGAIRVGGPRWLKAVIGRARENRSSAELELMSSTSHEVCELWNGEGIIRTTGKGVVKQIVFLKDYGCDDQECFLFTLDYAKDKHMKRQVYRGPLIRRLLRPKDITQHKDHLDRAPNISLNLHPKQATWELIAAAAAGILLQSGVLVFSGFVAYNSRFGTRVEGRPNAYAYPVLLAGTVTLAAGMWISALVIGASTEEFQWEVMPQVHPDDSPGKSEKGIANINTMNAGKPTCRVFWLQKGVFVSDQSFDSFMLVAKGEKESILTSCRNSDRGSHDESQYTGTRERSNGVSINLNILCIIGTFASITGFVLQFEGFRGISWACSIAQLVAIMIMTVLRAAVRRGMLDNPATEKITQEHEMDSISLRLGFDDNYLTSLSDGPNARCPQCGRLISNSKHNSWWAKITTKSIRTCDCLKTVETPFWKVANELRYPTNIINPKARDSNGGKDGEVSKGCKDTGPSVNRQELQGKRQSYAGTNARRPGYPRPQSLEKLKPNDAGGAVQELDENSLQVHAVVNIRKRLGKLTKWKSSPSEYALYVAKAIGKVMDSFDSNAWEGMTTFNWHMDIQIRQDESADESIPKQNGRLRLGVNYDKKTQNWKTSEEDIEAILSLWRYHFKDEKQRELRDQKAGTEPCPFNPELIRTPFRRVLGPATDVLKADLSWWAGEGAAEAMEEFTWVETDNPLSLGYGPPRDQNNRDIGPLSSCWAIVTNISMERFLAQHIFSAFMWSVAAHLPAIPSATSVDPQTENKFNPEDPSWDSLRLVNQKIVDLAKAVEGAALGTLEDAYTLIIPPLSVANKLPSEEGLVEMVRGRAIENHRDYQLDKAYSLYSRLLDLCDKRLFLNEKFVYKAVATTVDFLIHTASLAMTDERTTSEDEPPLKEAKAALVKLLKSKNLGRFSIALKELFTMQKRDQIYDSMLFLKDDKGIPQGDSSKQKRKDRDSRQDVNKKKDTETSDSRNFGYTEIYDQIIRNKGNFEADAWKHVDVCDILGWTPLHYSVIYATDKVSIILENKRNLAGKADVAGRIPLHYSVMYTGSCTKEVIGQLLDAYGRAVSGSDGILPLHLAAKYGNEAAAKALLESPLHRDRMSAGDYRKLTPLHFAAMECQLRIVKILLATREVKIDAQDKFERTALHLAVQKRNTDIVDAILRADDSRRVTKLKDKNDKTALQLAAELQRTVDDSLAKTKSDIESVEKKLDLPKKGEPSKTSSPEAEDKGKATETADIGGKEISRNPKSAIPSAQKEDNLGKGKPVETNPDMGQFEPQNTPSSSDEQKKKLEKKKLLEDLESLNQTKTKLSPLSKEGENIVGLLLDHEDLAVEGGKLLLWAAKERLSTAFRLLMDRQARTDAIDDSSDQSILHMAAMNGSDFMVQKILEHWGKKDTSVNLKDETGKAAKSLVNLEDKTGRTALMFAAIGGYSNIVDRLLAAGADRAALDQDNRTALSLAVEKGQVAIVKQLLDSDNNTLNGVDGNSPRSPLSRAAETGNLAMVKLLFEAGANIDRKDMESKGENKFANNEDWNNVSDHSPLRWAIVKGHKDVVDYFLTKTEPKPNVNEVDGQSKLTLLCEAIDADQMDIARQLLAANADVRKPSGPWKQTALCFAADLGRISFVSLLLDHSDREDSSANTDIKRPYIEEPDVDGWTPLMFAVWRNHEDTVKMLIEKGACAGVSGDLQTSALSLALDNDNDEMVSKLLGISVGEFPSDHLQRAIFWAAKRGSGAAVELLLQKGVEANARLNGSFPLLKAAKRGHVDIVSVLLSYEANVNLANKKGETALYWASYNGHEKVVRLLIQQREGQELVDLNVRTLSKSTALLAATRRGNEDVAIYLANEGADVNIEDDNKETPLYWACDYGSILLVTILIDKGAQPNTTTTDESTPLLQAIRSENTELVELLLEKGAEFEVSGVYSALNLASFLGEIDVVQHLLKRKADIMAKDQDGDTPLHQSAYNGHLEIAILLLAEGANPSAKNSSGSSPLHYTARNGHIAIAHLLLDHAAHADEGDDDGRTPLSLASEWGHNEVVRLLHDDHHARLESTDKDLRTPISWAASRGDDNIIKLLASLNAVLESRDRKQRTPLSWAASDDNVSAVNMLIKLGALVDTKDDDQRTPLSRAASSTYGYAVSDLLDAQADVLLLDSANRNALSWAVAEGNEEATRLLLQHDPDHQIDKQDVDGRTPLSYAVDSGNLTVVNLILGAKPSLEKPDTSGETALGLAARKDNEDVVLRLIEVGADPNVVDNSKRTPLFSAIHSGNDTAALKMLDKDLDKETHPEFSRTPLQEAMCQYSSEVVDKLLTRGADVNGKDIQGRDAMHIAAGRGSMDYLSPLIQKGLGIESNAAIPGMYDKADKQGRHALHHAACSRDTDVVEYLLQKFPDLQQRDQTDDNGWCPLHWAARFGEEKVVQQFLDIGANANSAEGLNGWTPLQVAQFHECDSVIDTLMAYFKERGVDPMAGREAIPPGVADDTRGCDGCSITPIYGAVWTCRKCGDFDFCYKCIGASEKTHPGEDHVFEQRKAPDNNQD